MRSNFSRGQWFLAESHRFDALFQGRTRMLLAHRVSMLAAVCVVTGGRNVIAQQFGAPTIREASDPEMARRCNGLGERIRTTPADSLRGVLINLRGCSSTGPIVAASLLAEPSPRTAYSQVFALADAFRDERVFIALSDVATNASQPESERMRALKSLVLYIDPTLVVLDRATSPGRWRFAFGNVDHSTSRVGDAAPSGHLIARVGAVMFEVAQQASRETDVGRAARDLLEQLRFRDTAALDIPAGTVTLSRRCGGGYVLTSTLPVMVSVDLRNGPGSGSHSIELVPDGKTTVVTAGPDVRAVYTGSRLLAALPAGDGCVTGAP